MVALLIGAITGAEFLFRIKGGIDDLLASSPVTHHRPDNPFPTRMSPITAFCLLCAGSGLLAFRPEKSRWTIAREIAAILTLTASALGLIGFVYGVPTFYRLGPYSSLAIHTTVAFLLLGCAMLAARPDEGLMAILTRGTAGSLLARRMLLAAILVPLVLGLLRVKGEQAGYFNVAFGTAVFATSVVLLFVSLVWWNAVSLDRAENARHERDRQLAALRELAMRYVSEPDLDRVLEDMVMAAMTITGAEKGTLQIFDPHTNSLQLRASKGFSPAWLAFYDRVHGEGATCGEALRTGRRIIVNDVASSPIFADTPARDLQLKEGVRAVVSTPLESRSGQILGMISTHFPQPHLPSETELHSMDLLARQAADVLERSLAEQRLEKLVDERTAALRDTVGELEAFSYTVAHDMRAPLRAMQSFSTLLLDDYAGQLALGGHDLLQRIADSANRLDHLIQDVLNYSKIVRADLPLEPVDTQGLIEEMIQSYPNLRPDAADITMASPLPAVVGNRAALTQVFSNLLGNAVKFVAPGVRPRITIRSEPAQLSTLFVRLYFEDNGIGIPAAEIPRLFQMFHRGHVPGEYEGTGMGLAIVRKAIERMGGRLGVESDVGKGSRFWIELKAAR